MFLRFRLGKIFFLFYSTETNCHCRRAIKRQIPVFSESVRLSGCFFFTLPPSFRLDAYFGDDFVVLSFSFRVIILFSFWIFDLFFIIFYSRSDAFGALVPFVYFVFFFFLYIAIFRMWSERSILGDVSLLCIVKKVSRFF